MKIHNLEEYFDNKFLKTLSFSIDDKVVREGKLKLMQQKTFNLSFYLLIGDKIKLYEIPYPFSMNEDNNVMEFDYRLKSIPQLDKKGIDIIHNFDTISKLLDNKLVITIT